VTSRLPIGGGDAGTPYRRRPNDPGGAASAPPRQAPQPAAQRRSLPRPRRWAAAVATLIDLQDDYRAWLDNLPANLEGSVRLGASIL
jgi:hypothetical protein